MAVRIAVAGAAGKMGRRIIALASARDDVRCVAALERRGSPAIGTDAGALAGADGPPVPVTEHPQEGFDVLVEFSTPSGTLAWLDECLRSARPIVIGTTGHTETEWSRIRAAARSIAVLKAPNMSVGVNVLLRTVRQLAGILDPSYDVEIVETHHRFKVDAPSGTALALRDAVMEGRKKAEAAESIVVYGRHGESGPRPSGEIAVHALRSGDVVGEHTVSFGTIGETVTVAHAARSRDVFAAGALRAAKWIAGRPPGLYDMQDVLFGETS
ncbi:MAG: 4-hydroxy-tetrahydrodipicolinate reductase [Phycisphaerae bacterium]